MVMGGGSLTNTPPIHDNSCDRVSLKETNIKQEVHVLIFFLIYINWATSFEEIVYHNNLCNILGALEFQTKELNWLSKSCV